MKIGKFDALTGEQIVREMTPEEIAQREEEIAAWKAEEKLRKQVEAEAEAKREAALSKLAALGLDAEDLKALGF